MPRARDSGSVTVGAPPVGSLWRLGCRRRLRVGRFGYLLVKIESNQSHGLVMNGPWNGGGCHIYITEKNDATRLLEGIYVDPRESDSRAVEDIQEPTLGGEKRAEPTCVREELGYVGIMITVEGGSCCQTPEHRVKQGIRTTFGRAVRATAAISHPVWLKGVGLFEPRETEGLTRHPEIAALSNCSQTCARWIECLKITRRALNQVGPKPVRATVSRVPCSRHCLSHVSGECEKEGGGAAALCDGLRLTLTVVSDGRKIRRWGLLRSQERLGS